MSALNEKKHEHEWMYCEIPEVYDGWLFRDCANCDAREVRFREKYNGWLRSLEKSKHSLGKKHIYLD